LPILEFIAFIFYDFLNFLVLGRRNVII